MRSNSLLCGARPVTGATEKGQPGSRLARAVCEPSLNSGTKFWLWSGTNTGPLALCKAERTPGTEARVPFCQSIPEEGLCWHRRRVAAAVCIRQTPSSHVLRELPKVLSEERRLQYLQLLVKVFWEFAQRSTGSFMAKLPHLHFSKVSSYLPFLRDSLDPSQKPKLNTSPNLSPQKNGFGGTSGALNQKLLLSYLLKHIYTANSKYKPANVNTCKHVLGEASRHEAQQDWRRSSLSFITAATKA